MTLFRPFAALLLAALAACATAPGEPPAPSVYVMRHLHKAEGPDPTLSAQGRADALRLIDVFAGDPPRAIFVSTTRRARETAAPLALKLGVKVQEYDPADTPALVARIKAEPGTALVVGHSNTVPEIVERLGGARPADLAESDFGDIFRVRRDGTVERLRL